MFSSKFFFVPNKGKIDQHWPFFNEIFLALYMKLDNQDSSWSPLYILLSIEGSQLPDQAGSKINSRTSLPKSAR